MTVRKVAVITLIQNLQDDNPPDQHELKHQIQHFFGSSALSKLWRVERVTFLEDTVIQSEPDQSRHDDETKGEPLAKRTTVIDQRGRLLRGE